jgi:predicted nucleic acid-binding protein
MGRPVPNADAMIASTAMETDCPILTENIKDFEPIDGLAVVSPGDL